MLGLPFLGGGACPSDGADAELLGAWAKLAESKEHGAGADAVAAE